MSVPQVRGVIDQWARSMIGPQPSTTAVVTIAGLAPPANPATVAPVPLASGQTGMAQPGPTAGYGYQQGASSLTSIVVDSITITNTTGATGAFTIAYVPAGLPNGPVAAPNYDLYTAVSIAANASVTLPTGPSGPIAYLAPGDKMTFKGGATGLNLTATIRTDREDFGR